MKISDNSNQSTTPLEELEKHIQRFDEAVAYLNRSLDALDRTRDYLYGAYTNLVKERRDLHEQALDILVDRQNREIDAWLRMILEEES